MSRFADPSVTRTIDCGACQCDGTPHDHDEAVVRAQLGGSALKRIEQANVYGALAGDELAADRQLLLECLVSWTFLAGGAEVPINERTPVPINERMIGELDAVTLTTISKAAVEVINEGQLPNVSGAPSVASPQESASPTPTPIPTPGT